MKLVNNKIRISDITQRHPIDLHCETDAQYASLANDIKDLLYDSMSFMDDEQQKRNVCISLALYFEDLHSETHQFETFQKLYCRMFGRYVPFMDSVDERSPEAELDAMTFVFWLVVAAERDGKMLNPLNTSLRNIAQKLLNLWNRRKAYIRPNEELADHLYCEETQEDAMEVRNVLVWIESKCFMGHWFTNSNPEGDEYELEKMLHLKSEEQLKYGNDCIAAFDHRAWPLSLSAQQIYAEMIRIDMDDPDDEVAAQIEKIEYLPLDMYRVMQCTNNGVHIRDYQGKDYVVSNLQESTLKHARKHSHAVGSFFRYQSSWYYNGMVAWLDIDPEIYRHFVEEKQKVYSYMHDYEHQYDDYLARHGGDRLVFFKNEKQYKSWMKEELGITKMDSLMGKLPFDEPFVIFIEPNGQATHSFVAKSICHKGNPYYDRTAAQNSAMIIVASSEYTSPDLTMYLIQKDLLPDAAFNDFRGTEHGRKLMQENIEFVARCMRRDIKSETVCRRRSDMVFDDEKITNVEYGSKIFFDQFVKLIAEENRIRSKANKEWVVVSCDDSTTVVRDVANNKEFTFSTQSLHRAHFELDENEIQISALVPFVGKECAPAATAVLYNVVGRGRHMNSLRKFVNQWFKN